MAIWYWHFVDVVWILVFLVIYWWGNSNATVPVPFEIFDSLNISDFFRQCIPQFAPLDTSKYFKQCFPYLESLDVSKTLKQCLKFSLPLDSFNILKIFK